MAGEWRSLPAEQFCASVRDGTHDSPKPAVHGRFLVTSRHITGGRLDLGNAYLISQEDFDAINKRSKVDKWDVLISMIGTVGEPCLIKEEPNFAIKNIGLFKSKGEVEGKWLYYYLSSSDSQQLIREHARGTTQQYIPLGSLREFPILVPDDRDKMRAIVHILGTLDDKIELNRRMNTTLEAIAQALFKSWFVDFDPVRAKAEGHDTSLPKPIADLFPDSFEDSELGEIPKGWEIQSIGDLADVVGGTTPSTKESAYWEGGTYAWATPKDLSGLSVPVLLNTERQITDAGLLQIGSGLLPMGTVLLSSRAPIGYLAVAEIPVAINQGFIAMTPKTGTPNIFLLLWASVAHEEIVSRANGSTFLEISKTNFRPIPVVTPSATVMRVFEKLARPLYERIVESAHESRTLAALRDALLPKLISGELRVRGLKKTISGDGHREVDCNARMPL